MKSTTIPVILGLLLLLALASAGKKKKRKNGSKTKKPKKICLETALLFEVGGSTETVTGSTLSALFPTAPETNNTECDKFVSASNLDDYVKCVQRQGWAEIPFSYNSGVGPTATFEFNENEQAIGAGAFYGTVGANDLDKIIINYFDEEYFNTNTAIESIQYQYFIEDCGSGANPCDEQFYLNVYLRESTTRTNFFDCKYDFAPDDTTPPTGVWQTHTILATDTPTTVPVEQGPVATMTCPPTLADAFAAGYVLGAGAGAQYILAFNMGDNDVNDIGLKGYFDDIQIKYEGEDRRIYDLDPPKKGRRGSSSSSETA